MSWTLGDQVRVDWPASPLHGATGTIVRPPSTVRMAVPPGHVFVDVPAAGSPFLFRDEHLVGR